ncbi:MAG: hypothetical protein Rubg2KO_15380 [Rubricoccaceae bacterium]
MSTETKRERNLRYYPKRVGDALAIDIQEAFDLLDGLKASNPGYLLKDQDVTLWAVSKCLRRLADEAEGQMNIGLQTRLLLDG